jgi:hypothetical protein
LIEKWHGRDRLSYAVTPRFAITSSEEQLRQAGRLLKEYPDAYLHTHLAKNEEEVAQVARQFPWSRSYLDVYERFGLVRERSVFARCIQMHDDDRKLMARKGAAMALPVREAGEHYLPDLPRRVGDDEYQADPELSDAARAHTGNGRRALKHLDDAINLVGVPGGRVAGTSSMAE